MAYSLCIPKHSKNLSNRPKTVVNVWCEKSKTPWWFLETELYKDLQIVAPFTYLSVRNYFFSLCSQFLVCPKCALLWICTSHPHFWRNSLLRRSEDPGVLPALEAEVFSVVFKPSAITDTSYTGLAAYFWCWRHAPTRKWSGAESLKKNQENYCYEWSPFSLFFPP